MGDITLSFSSPMDIDKLIHKFRLGDICLMGLYSDSVELYNLLELEKSKDAVLKESVFSRLEDLYMSQAEEIDKKILFFQKEISMPIKEVSDIKRLEKMIKELGKCINVNRINLIDILFEVGERV